MGFPRGNPMNGRWAQHYRDQTPAERSLEPAIAALGLPYRFQHPVHLYNNQRRYFLDFALLGEGIIIEVDDKSHKKKVAEDALRTEELLREGWRAVLRCTNEEALSDPFGTIAVLFKEYPHLLAASAEPSREVYPITGIWPDKRPPKKKKG